MRISGFHGAALLLAAVCITAGGCGPTPGPNDSAVDAALADGGATGGTDGGLTLAAYGQACAAALGTLPLTWSCQPDGGVLLDVGPIVAGAPAVDGGSPTACANPPWLTLDDHKNQCVPGARLLALKTSNPNTEVRVICRRYTVRSDADTHKFYEDIAVVASNAVTGDTCFFQALAGANDTLDGTNVPSPMADPTKPAEAAVAAAAASFWYAPKDLSSGALKCSLCHDNDAWMHTPYVDQADGTPAAVPSLTSARNVDTWNRNTILHADPYQLVNGAFFFSKDGWPQPVGIRTAKVKDDTAAPGAPPNITEQACTRCHRISSGTPPAGSHIGTYTGQRWIDWTTNGHLITQISSGAPWHDYLFMPDETLINDGTLSSTQAQWDSRWLKHIKALHCCTQHPDYQGCLSYNIFGIKTSTVATPGANPPGKCIDDSGDVALGVMIPAPAYAGRADGDNDCDTHAYEQRCVTMKITHTLVDGTSQVITQDENGLPLGYCIPDDTGYTGNYQVFPGDVVELTLDGISAWDSGDDPLEFTTWMGADPTQCPCENPASTLCRFTTKGASDWFGTNPDGPEIPGDPPEFACAPQFSPSGMCAAACGSGTPQLVVSSDASWGGTLVRADCVSPYWLSESTLTPAQWIWTSECDASDDSVGTFTGTFSLTGPFSCATLEAAADNYAFVSINGVALPRATTCNPPFGGSPVAVDICEFDSVTALDVASLLVSGSNTVTIEVHNFPTGSTGGWGNPEGLLARLSVF